MNEISFKAILIGVSILVTLIIFSVILLAFGQMRSIYSSMDNIDVSIKSTVDEIYSMYNNSVLNGIKLVNTVKKYESDKYVNVLYLGVGYSQPTQANLELLSKTASQWLNEKMKSEAVVDQHYRYEHEFNVSVTKSGEIYTITFVKI